MQEIEMLGKLLDKYAGTSLAWVIAIVFLAYLAKRYVLQGAWAAAQKIIEMYFKDRKDHLETQIQLANDLRFLTTQIKDIAESLLENRRIIMDRVLANEEIHRAILVNTQQILAIIPKRQSDFAGKPSAS